MSPSTVLAAHPSIALCALDSWTLCLLDPRSDDTLLSVGAQSAFVRRLAGAGRALTVVDEDAQRLAATREDLASGQTVRYLLGDLALHAEAIAAVDRIAVSDVGVRHAAPDWCLLAALLAPGGRIVAQIRTLAGQTDLRHARLLATAASLEVVMAELVRRDLNGDGEVELLRLVAERHPSSVR